MSINCIAERYTALRFMFRISADYVDADMDTAANLLAEKCEEVLHTKGSNIFSNNGRWDGESENGRTIEVVRRADSQLVSYDGVATAALEEISRYVNVALGLTCFATVESTTAFELYELSE